VIHEDRNSHLSPRDLQNPHVDSVEDIEITLEMGLGLVLDDNMVVTMVATNGPAYSHKVRNGDKLIGVNGNVVSLNHETLREAVAEHGENCVLHFNSMPRLEPLPPAPRGEPTPIKDFFLLPAVSRPAGVLASNSSWDVCGRHFDQLSESKLHSSRNEDICGP
jgi:predicted metalloprotease with PDZ domain